MCCGTSFFFVLTLVEDMIDGMVDIMLIRPVYQPLWCL